MSTIPRILTIAGSDSGGGAGIQADCKAITALGGYAMTAITALTAQNTQSVAAIHAVAADFIVQQIEVVASDIGVDAVKTGMLHNAQVMAAVARLVRTVLAGVPLVIDPVMVATSGASLIDDEAIAVLKSELLPLATVMTPNVPEAAKLTGLPIESPDQMMDAAEALAGLGARAVLLKGGHLAGERVHDLLWHDGAVTWLDAPRLHTRHTHGTGCTLAAALATALGAHLPLLQAARIAHDYVQQALHTAPKLGKGHGPLGVPIVEPMPRNKG